MEEKKGKLGKLGMDWEVAKEKYDEMTGVWPIQ